MALLIAMCLLLRTGRVAFSSNYMQTLSRRQKGLTGPCCKLGDQLLAIFSNFINLSFLL